MKSKIPIYTCMCCKTEFESQKRFSRRDKKYRNYCPNCRKICYLCLCRHGGQGDTCSQYCKKKYTKLRRVWRNLNPKKDIKYLENALKGFHLKRLEDDCLCCYISLGNLKPLKDNASKIRTKMIDLQDHTKLVSKDRELQFGRNSIDKSNFEIDSPLVSNTPIYNLKSWIGYLKYL